MRRCSEHGNYSGAECGGCVWDEAHARGHAEGYAKATAEIISHFDALSIDAARGRKGPFRDTYSASAVAQIIRRGEHAKADKER